MNHELPKVQAGFKKGRGTRDQIANTCWIIEKAREFQKKNHTSIEEFDLCLCDESFIFLYIFGEAKVGEKKEDGGGDAHREENRSINCFVGELVIFSFM